MPKKILLIEDEEDLTDLYKIKFDQEGFQIIIAHDGAEGIKLALKEQPDLILVDLVMPKMDGYQVLEKLRSQAKTKNIKTYVFSNLGQEKEIEKGFKNGANGYLIKSNLTPTELVETVEKIFKGEKVGLKKPNSNN